MKKVIFIFCLLLMSSCPADARIFGLVVGINHYVSHPDLRGAVNDARDISDALHSIGAEKVILLLNEKATYDTVKQSWYRLIQEAAPGDTIVFSYAGHGGRGPEQVPGSEADHKDDAFILGGFREHGPGTRERIIDNEINAWLKDAKEQSIIMIADSCFSGTMLRGLDVRASGTVYRTIDDYGPLVNDYHPPPPVQAASLTADDLPHVTFFSSSRENEKTPEILINSVPRGALSWAFARALRNAATNGSSALTRGSLEHYLRENILMCSEGRQHPTFIPRGRDDQVLLQVAGQPAAQPAPAGARLPKLPRLRVQPIGSGSASLLRTIRGVQPVTAAGQADLILDNSRHQVLNSLGDVVTHSLAPGKQSVQRVVDKWRLLVLLRRLSEQQSLVLRLSRGDISYHRGESFTLSVSGGRFSFFTLFSLDPDGTASLLYPLPEYNDPPRLSAFPFTLPLEIIEPYGAEHLMAIVSDRLLTGLQRALTGIGTGSPLVLEKELRQLYRQGGYQSGLIGLYSVP